MSDETATQTMQHQWKNDMRVDRRRRTADALTHLLDRAIAPFLSEERHAREDAMRAIHGVLMQKGIMVLSEGDRQEMGLPLRDDLGWTDDEIRAYESRFLLSLLEPPRGLLLPK